MRDIELSAGTIEYQDTGDGPALVLLHGLMMDASLWDEPIADLSADHRCVAPTLPLGAHRHAMHADADLQADGLACVVCHANYLHLRVAHVMAGRSATDTQVRACAVARSGT